LTVEYLQKLDAAEYRTLIWIDAVVPQKK